MKALCSYEWPGNIRELQNELQRYLTEQRLEFIGNVQAEPFEEEGFSLEGLSFNEIVEAFEKRVLARALAQNYWHQGKTAAILSVVSVLIIVQCIALIPVWSCIRRLDRASRKATEDKAPEEPVPTPARETRVYIMGREYHLRYCERVQPFPQNVMPISKAIETGYRPCNICMKRRKKTEEETED